MRFSSIGSAILQAGEGARRFPWTLAAGVVATGTAITAIAGPERAWHLRLLAVAVIGLSTLTAVTTAAERAGASAGRRHLFETGVAAALGALFAASARWPDAQSALRFAQLLVAAHLLVAVLPYAPRGALRGFWQFNRFLFVRFLLATFYASVLWIGLAVALVAVNKLLGVSVPADTYGDLWAVLAFLFHPWFLLSGIPRDYHYLDELDDYPIGIKIFTQFVLIPLVTVYLAILLLYLGRIIITQTWPSGWIGYLVSSVSVIGVLALLLVHPIRDRADSQWVNAYGRWFFVALLAPLVMLLMAVGKRVGQYGVTEPRYFLLVLGLWGLGVALSYAFTGSRNIKVIPMTLAGLTLLTAFGPWGAYQVSRRSQLHRLDRIVTAAGMGRVGAITRPGRELSMEDRQEIGAVINYLYSRHGAGALARALGVPPDTVLRLAAASDGRVASVPERVMNRLGLEYVRPGERVNGETFGFNLPQPAPIQVSGFDRLQTLSLWPRASILFAPDSITLVADSTLSSVAVTRGRDTVATLDILGALRARGFPEGATGAHFHTVSDPLIVDGAARGLGIRLVLASLNGNRQGERVRVSSLTGYLLVREQ
jgi:hypothetical protein